MRGGSNNLRVSGNSSNYPSPLFSGVAKQGGIVANVDRSPKIPCGGKRLKNLYFLTFQSKSGNKMFVAKQGGGGLFAKGS